MSQNQGFIQDFISGDVSKNRGVAYTRDLRNYLLTYLLTYLLECCCVYLVHLKFDLCTFPITVDKQYVCGLC